MYHMSRLVQSPGRSSITKLKKILFYMYTRGASPPGRFATSQKGNPSLCSVVSTNRKRLYSIQISRKINRGIHLAGTHFKRKGCLILAPNSNSVGTLFALYLWNQLIYHFEHLTVQSSYFCAIHIPISAF